MAMQMAIDTVAKKIKRVFRRPFSSGYALTPAALVAKRRRRRAECRWRRLRTPASRQTYVNASNIYNQALKNSRSSYFSKLLAKHSSNAKSSWRTLNRLMNNKKNAPPSVMHHPRIPLPYSLLTKLKLCWLRPSQCLK
jgi:hypothetical protein